MPTNFSAASEPLVATCGLTTLDLIQYVEHPPGVDEKVQSLSSLMDVGGPAANAAVTAVGLGARCRLISAVGRGPLADYARSRIAELQVDLREVQTGPGWQLPVSSVVVDANGARSVVSSNSEGAVTAEVPEQALAGVSAVLVDGHHMDTCLEVAAGAHRAGVPVLLDGGSWKPGMERLIALVDAAVLSSDFTTPEPSPAFESRLWQDKPVAVTAGGQPIRFRWGQSGGTVPVADVDVVDTTGAGDVFHGAWLVFVATEGLRTDTFADGLEYAAQIATESCLQRGARVAPPR